MYYYSNNHSKTTDCANKHHFVTSEYHTFNCQITPQSPPRTLRKPSWQVRPHRSSWGEADSMRSSLARTAPRGVSSGGSGAALRPPCCAADPCSRARDTPNMFLANGTACRAPSDTGCAQSRPEWPTKSVKHSLSNKIALTWKSVRPQPRINRASPVKTIEASSSTNDTQPCNST